MKLTRPRNRLGRLVLTLLAVLLMSTPSFAAVYELRADTTTVSMPDGVPITVWGFADDTAGTGEITVPGPMLEVPPGDTTLTINLTNNLTVPVSIVIPGQPSQLNPVYIDGRVVSFTDEAAAGGGTLSFTWNNMKPGTYIYHSGSNPALQVHMGLYGGVKVVPAVGSAYTDVLYDAEVVMFYSEIDPGLHDPVPLPAQPLRYDPAYFLINGAPFAAGTTGPLALLNTNQRVLIRFLNAGLKSHVPTLQGGYWTAIAEDGNIYPYPKEQYTAFLPAMKTMDVIWTPGSADTYAIYDKTHHLTNAGSSGGGMLAYLQVGLASTPTVNITAPFEGASFMSGDEVTFIGTANDAEDGDISANLTWESSNDGPIGSGSTVATSTLSVGTHTITASVTDADSNTGTDSISIHVGLPNTAPLVTISEPLSGDAFDEGSPVTFTGSAIDEEDGEISAGLSWTSSIDGTIGTGSTFVTSALSPGSHMITASVTDSGGLPGSAMIASIIINDLNDPPVAVDDYATTTRNSTDVFIFLVENDYDSDGAIDPDSIVIVTQPTRRGTAVVVSSGVLFTPKKNFLGTDVFTYTVNDDQGATSNTATVRVNVVR